MQGMRSCPNKQRNGDDRMKPRTEKGDQVEQQRVKAVGERVKTGWVLPQLTRRQASGGRRSVSTLMQACHRWRNCLQPQTADQSTACIHIKEHKLSHEIQVSTPRHEFFQILWRAPIVCKRFTWLVLKSTVSQVFRVSLPIFPTNAMLATNHESRRTGRGAHTKAAWGCGQLLRGSGTPTASLPFPTRSLLAPPPLRCGGHARAPGSAAGTPALAELLKDPRTLFVAVPAFSTPPHRPLLFH